jgi:hypothetical protein
LWWHCECGICRWTSIRGGSNGTFCRSWFQVVKDEITQQVFVVVVLLLLVVVLLVVFVVVVLLVVVAALVALALPRSGGTGAATSIIGTLASGQLGREGRIFGALATGVAAIGLGGAG